MRMLGFAGTVGSFRSKRDDNSQFAFA